MPIVRERARQRAARLRAVELVRLRRHQRLRRVQAAGCVNAFHGDRAFPRSRREGVYRRFREQGRMMPEGLTYVGSWIEANFDRCFQLMECDDARLLQDCC